MQRQFIINTPRKKKELLCLWHFFTFFPILNTINYFLPNTKNKFITIVLVSVTVMILYILFSLFFRSKKNSMKNFSKFKESKRINLYGSTLFYFFVFFNLIFFILLYKGKLMFFVLFLITMYSFYLLLKLLLKNEGKCS